MFIKEGIFLVELWEGLGVNWRLLFLLVIQDILEKINVGFVYLFKYFFEVQKLVIYWEEIGKCFFLVILELIWVFYVGKYYVVVGFVYFFMENMIVEVFSL